MTKNNLILALKTAIWLCLVVIMLCPLFLNPNLFFPFISTKFFIFSSAVEVMIVAFLILAWQDKNYRLRFNFTILLMLVYLAILTMASLLGNDFYNSFWSSNERGDGLLLFGHLFLLILVLISFVKNLKEWLYLFDLFVVGSLGVSIVALVQYFTYERCIDNTVDAICRSPYFVSTTGARLSATIGNPGFVAAYLIFAIFLALFLFFKRSQIGFRIYYGLLILLELFIIIQTQTRGAYLALGFCGLVFIFYLCFFHYRHKYLQIGAIILAVVLLLSSGFLLASRDSAWVKDNRILKRVATISLSEGTVGNRLVTWQMAWRGFKEKPILGWGQENFYQVFNKYYTTKNFEPWFDRSHNIFFDRLITGGIVGLISYLSLLFLPFYFLWHYYYSRKKEEFSANEKETSKYFMPIIFSLIFIAYFIQNLFVFESLVVYIPLFLILAFVSRYGPEYQVDFLNNSDFKKWSAIILVVMLFPAIYIFNLKPLQANADLIKVSSNLDADLIDKINGFEEIINRDTFGNQEYRREYFNFYQDTFSIFIKNGQDIQTMVNNEALKNFSSRVHGYLNEQIAENPYNVRNYLDLLTFYNLSYFFDANYLNLALETYQQSIILSPNRPVVYYGGAIAYYNLASYNEENKSSASIITDNYRLAAEAFYRGISLEEEKKNSLNQLMNFLSLSNGNKGFMSLIAKEGISGRNFSDLAGEVVSWVKTKDDKRNADLILYILLNHDPENQQLKNYQEQLKQIEL